MGRHTWADVVPFVMHNAFVYSGAGNVLSEVKQKLITPEERAFRIAQRQGTPRKNPHCWWTPVCL